MRYGRSIRVDGYRKSSWGWDRKTLDIFLVGPATTHLEDAIHGPGLQLRAADEPAVDIAFHAVFTGTLVEKGSPECLIDVSALASGSTTLDGTGMSSAEALAVQQGQDQLILIRITCLDSS